MAGLNFQTQTIINANVDADSNGKVLFSKPTNKEGVVLDENALQIKRDFIFKKANVKAIRKAEGHNPTMCKVVIDFSKITELQPDADNPKKYGRLDIYLGVEGAEPFIYSAPWVQKGIPFWVEFTVTEKNKAAIADHVANMIKQNNLFQVDKDLLKVTAEGNILTLEGATEYQRFRNVDVNVFDASADYSDKIASLKDGDFSEGFVRGTNGFGTYSQIIKDLRLPTAENTHWTHIRQAETPVVGAVYNQYIIEYCAPASNDGLAAVGQKLESHTTHVFWVKRESAEVAGALVTAWETALAAIDPDGGSVEEENIAATVEDRLSELEKA